MTGASAGIGAVIAADLAAKGYNLVLVARRGERLDANFAGINTVAKDEAIRDSTDGWVLDPHNHTRTSSR